MRMPPVVRIVVLKEISKSDRALFQYQLFTWDAWSSTMRLGLHQCEGPPD